MNLVPHLKGWSIREHRLISFGFETPQGPAQQETSETKQQENVSEQKSPEQIGKERKETADKRKDAERKGSEDDRQKLKEIEGKMEKAGLPKKVDAEATVRDLTQTAENLHRKLLAGDKEVKPLQVFEAYSNAMAALQKQIRAYQTANRDFAPPRMMNAYSDLNAQRNHVRNLLTDAEEADLPRIVREANRQFGKE